MASSPDDLELTSDGIDRARLHESPPISAVTRARSHPKPVNDRTHRLRQSIGKKLNALIHPSNGIDKVKDVLDIGYTNSADQPGVRVDNDEPAPILAPRSSVETPEMRLTHETDDRLNIPSMKELLRDPVSTTKKWMSNETGTEFARTAGQTAVSHEANVNMLRQEQKVNEASTEDEKLAEMEDLVRLKYLRQDEFVRWSTDRHIRKVTVIENPPPSPQRPPVVGSLQGQWSTYGKLLLQHGLEKYGQHYVGKSPQMDVVDESLLNSSLERLVVASIPLQTLIMKARSICMWEDSTESTLYMVGYFFLVFYNQVASAMILFVLIGIIYRSINPTTLSDMRASITDAENTDITAQHITELITQHGTRTFVSRALEEAAPTLYYILEHGADTLEMMQNTYEWRDPPRTKYTLCLLFCALISVLAMPTWLLVKTSCYFVGVMFFILIPLGRHFPRYRLLCSPFTWLMWKTPTHVDWAIARLQAEAKQQLRDPSASLRDVTDRVQMEKPRLIGIFDCEEGGKEGRLLVTSASISFVKRRSRDPIWRIPFSELDAIHKITETSFIRQGFGLLFVGKGDTPSYQVAGLADRDEVFSQIVGYSGLPWKRIA